MSKYIKHIEIYKDITIRLSKIMKIHRNMVEKQTIFSKVTNEELDLEYLHYFPLTGRTVIENINNKILSYTASQYFNGDGFEAVISYEEAITLVMYYRDLITEESIDLSSYKIMNHIFNLNILK